MTVIKAQLDTLDNPLEVHCPPAVLLELLHDIPRMARLFPALQSLERVNDTTYRWHLLPQRYAGAVVKARYCVRYTRTDDELHWAPADRSEGIQIQGRMVVSAGEDGATSFFGLMIHTESEYPVPRFMTGLAASVASKEMASQWRKFMRAIKAEAEANMEHLLRIPIVSPPTTEENRPPDHDAMVSQCSLFERVFEQRISCLYPFVPFKGDRDTHKAACQRLQDLVASLAGITRGSYVLDVACTSAMGPATYIAERTGAVVCDIQMTEKMGLLARAEGVNSGEGEEEMTTARRIVEDLAVGELETIPYDSDTFDAVIFFETVGHMKDKTAFFRECLRVLKNGGILAGTDWLVTHTGLSSGNEALMTTLRTENGISELETLASFGERIERAGFHLREAVDMSREGDLSPNFEHFDATVLGSFIEQPKGYLDPIVEILMSAFATLVKATRAGCFTLGRFVAVKMGSP